MLEDNLEKEFKEAKPLPDGKKLKQDLDVFISYSSLNKNVADAVVSSFEQNGIRCWYAPRDIMPGQEWVTAIHEAINASKLFVLIYTDSSNESRQVANEVALAFNSGKTLIPFRLSDTEMSTELEYYLTRVHWLDAVNPPLMQSIESLMDYSKRILDGEVVKEAKDYNGKTLNSGKKNKSDNRLLLLITALAAVAVVAIIVVVVLNNKNKDGNSTQAEKDKLTDVPTITDQASPTKDPKNDVNPTGEAITETPTEDPTPSVTDPENMTDTELYRLAYEYQTGTGVENNLELAYEYYMKTGSAITDDEKIAEAMYLLGNIFCNGEGVEQNYEIGIEMYEKAILSGNSSAMNAMGNLYLRGDGVDDDYEKAFEYFKLSADNGNEVGMYNLAYMYENGYGTNADEEKAQELYKASAEKGYTPAQSKIK
jgi:hypothetical protein